MKIPRIARHRTTFNIALLSRETRSLLARSWWLIPVARTRDRACNAGCRYRVLRRRDAAAPFFTLSSRHRDAWLRPQV
jgi:hypothetical protein